MTAWMQLCVTSLGMALPLIFFFRQSSTRRLMRGSAEKAHSWISGDKVFILGGLGLACLYASTLKQFGTFDEFEYSIGLREVGIHPGHNHFLSHFFGYLAYRFVQPWTHDTKRVLEVLNMGYTLGMIAVIRQIIRRGGIDTALANATALVLGLSYGIWKYATSAEVYPLMLLAWTLCLWQGVRILQGNDSWSQFGVLAVLSNLTVLAHDMASYMCFGFGAAFFLTAPRGRKITWLTRYATTGLLLLPFFLWGSAYLMGFHSLDGFIQHHLYYYLHPDTHPGDYHYTTLGNTFIVAREGLYSMWTGIESIWKSFPAAQRVIVMATHTAVAACLGILYISGLTNVRTGWRASRSGFGPLILVGCNWLAVYIFCLFLRPNDEWHYWLLPFTGLSFSLALCGAGRQRVNSCVLALILLAPFVFLAASGLYSSSAVKLLNGPTTIPWLKDLPDSDRYVFSYTDDVLQVRYHRPAVLILRDPEHIRAALKSGKEVFIHQAYFSSFKAAGYSMAPSPFPQYVHLTQKPFAKIAP